MRGMMRLALLGVPGARGAGTRIYDFAAGATWPGTWTVADGALVPAPTLGPELYSNPGNPFLFQSGAPVGFTVSATPPNSEVSEVDAGQLHGGTNETGGYLNLYSDGTALVGIYPSPHLLSINRWYRISAEVDAYGVGTAYFRDSSWGVRAAALVSTGLYIGTGKAAAAALTTGTSGASALDITFRQLSCKLINTASCVDPLEAAWDDVRATAAFEMAPYTAVGLAHWVDADNHVVAYFTGGGSLVLGKRVAGTWTQLHSVLQAHAANKALQLDRSGTTYTLLWDGAIITTKTIDDAVFGASRLWTPFSTFEGNVFSYFALSRSGHNP